MGKAKDMANFVQRNPKKVGVSKTEQKRN
jgi:hypothetical protein